jgi:Methyltransferase domain
MDTGRVARGYDDEHGGEARARDAAAAVDALFDEHLGPRRLVLDLAAGPASVGRLLTGTVVALDRSPDFTAAADAVLPGRAVRADAGAALPLGTGTVDAVITVWWLHMAPDPAGVVVAAGHAAGLDLTGARSFPGHGHPDAESRAGYPVLAFRAARPDVRGPIPPSE